MTRATCTLSKQLVLFLVCLPGRLVPRTMALPPVLARLTLAYAIGKHLQGLHGSSIIKPIPTWPTVYVAFTVMRVIVTWSKLIFTKRLVSLQSIGNNVSQTLCNAHERRRFTEASISLTSNQIKHYTHISHFVDIYVHIYTHMYIHFFGAKHVHGT